MNPQKRNSNFFNLDKFSAELPDILFMPYTYNFHWRLLIVNMKERNMCLLDLYGICFANSSKSTKLDVLKNIEWNKKKGMTRPLQDQTDTNNCGLYVMY